MSVEIEWPLACGPEAVWRHLTDMRSLHEWLGVPLRVDVRVEGVVEIDHGDGAVCVSRVLACDRELRHLKVTWEFPEEPESVLSVSVGAGATDSSDESSALLLRHDGLGVLVDEYRDGWRTHLTYFAASLAGEPLAMREFWNVHEQLVEQGSHGRD
ncbi:MAG: SRPBCC domain-containing protein [Agrococcus casei]|uniref:SRPBCC domain-containing protein n=1 Tax=Agrococcus casei TaxID=343512 RepID=UPI003F9091D3